jgi:hypothetical protein
MGLKSSAYICQHITNAVFFGASKCSFQVIKYLDDFASADTKQGALGGFEHLAQLLRSLGLNKSADKAAPQSLQMAFLGVWLDTINMTVEVTPDRLQELQQEFEELNHRSSATHKQVQSLLGKLNFVAKCIRLGRLFMTRMLDWLHTLRKECPQLIPSSFRQGLSWWQKFIVTFNSTHLIPPTIWGKHDQHLETDACLSGWGGVCGQQYIHLPVPANLRSQSILEAYAVMIALKLWAAQLTGTRISLQCDNSTTVHAINNLCTCSYLLQKIVCEITYICAINQLEVCAVHIPGLHNRIQDWLSCWHLDPVYPSKFNKFNAKAKFVLTCSTPVAFFFPHLVIYH